MPHAAPPLLVAGLCAQWCGACRDWQPLFERQARAFTGQADFAWVDVEDHDEVMGHLDVENFPTLMIARGDEVLFYGTITPHEQTLVRLVQTALEGGMKPVDDDELDGLPQRVRSARS
ncbi:MAG TPA: thioredoxin family protein [Albitalea sp.]|uniref:thioredoxin family protein n=1 Tax=Piscinibacter sp. TaxID=1903157 RepID=UPI002ED0AE60